MSAHAQPNVSPGDYLAWERRQETRHEYVNGEIHAMTGASRKHNLINGNIAANLHARMRDMPCEVYSNDMRVKVNATGLYTYPNIVAACGEPQFEDAEVDTLLNPLLIVEVLSASTEAYDRGAKFLHYRKLPSLREYVRVAQTEYRVEHYLRQAENHWLLTELSGLDETLSLVSVGCALPLRELYERVDL
ncbi:MAG: Uma2 family endonuclease [Sulfurisoma sp.]|nr:Uma2 family endonuclease [Sulfurisoma sp.]